MSEPAFDHTRIVPFPSRDYTSMHRLQQRALADRIALRTPDLIFLGEHDATVTLGRGFRQPPPPLGVPVVAVERGGQATWHGPGQLVGYPILDLRNLDLDVRRYLRELETALIEVVAEFGVEAGVREGATGVWVGQRKIASLGVAVRRHVTYHGFALNVDPDLSQFAQIQPCGFSPEVMTSLTECTGQDCSMAEVTLRTVQSLVRRLRLAPPVWERAAP